MNHVRLATEDEVKAIRDKSDIIPESLVYALENQAGDTDLAVVRQVWEIDPLWPAKTSGTSQKARFIWGLEERFLAFGVAGYYFTAPADEASKPWRETIKAWGGEQVSEGPVFRYKKVLRKAS